MIFTVGPMFFDHTPECEFDNDMHYLRGTQREYSSKPLKRSIVERILVFKR